MEGELVDGDPGTRRRSLVHLASGVAASETCPWPSTESGDAWQLARAALRNDFTSCLLPFSQPLSTFCLWTHQASKGYRKRLFFQLAPSKLQELVFDDLPV
jgi:hypothetical protein